MTKFKTVGGRCATLPHAIDHGTCKCVRAFAVVLNERSGFIISLSYSVYDGSFLTFNISYY